MAGQWLAVDPPPGALVINIGDMLQRLTNHVLPSTTHRVRNPAGDARRAAAAIRCRSSSIRAATFRSPRCPAASPRTIPTAIPWPITADAFLQERLREIGLA